VSGTSRALRLGEYLVRRACRMLASASQSRLVTTAVDAAVVAADAVVAVARVVWVAVLAAVPPGAAAGIAVVAGASGIGVTVAAVTGLAVEAVPAVFIIWVSAGIRREDRSGSLYAPPPGASARAARRVTGFSAWRCSSGFGGESDIFPNGPG
jgi:hypothetical protein